MGEMKEANTILPRKPEGKRPLGRPRYRWECNTKMKMGVRVCTGSMWLRIESNGRLL
jgi:hypothetical protein